MPVRSATSVPKALAQGARALWRMLVTVRNHRDAAIFLVARSFYVDGMTAVLLFTGVYATGVMHWGALEMLFYGIILTILAVLGGFVGGWLDARLGPKRAVQIEIGMSLLGIFAILGMAPDRILFFWHYNAALHAPLWNGPFFRTLPEWVFLLIGFSNAVFITAQYASSRTLLTRLTPPAQATDPLVVDLDRPLDVPMLARHAGLSERSFYRKFTEATGKTPAHFVETLRLDAARALRIGLVEEVHDTHAALFEAAKELARRIAANPPLVVQGVKHVLNAASERTAAESLRTVALWNAAFLPSHDLREAMASFMEKRPAKFEGR